MGFFDTWKHRLFFAIHYEDIALRMKQVEDDRDRAMLDSANLRLRIVALEGRLNKISEKHKNCVIEMKRQQENWKVKKENLQSQNKALFDRIEDMKVNNPLAEAFEQQADRLRKVEADLEYERKAERLVYDFSHIDPYTWCLVGWLPDNATLRKICSSVPVPVKGFTEDGEIVDQLVKEKKK